jgi:hypothetical protein
MTDVFARAQRELERSRLLRADCQMLEREAQESICEGKEAVINLVVLARHLQRQQRMWRRDRRHPTPRQGAIVDLATFRREL